MKRLLMTVAVLATGAVNAHSQQEDYACLVAAHRLLFFTIEEAEGSKLEQMLKSIEERGGHSALAMGMAPDLDPQSCAYLVMAPGEAVRDLAKQTLPLLTPPD